MLIFIFIVTTHNTNDIFDFQEEKTLKKEGLGQFSSRGLLIIAFDHQA